MTSSDLFRPLDVYLYLCDHISTIAQTIGRKLPCQAADHWVPLDQIREMDD